MKIIDNKGRLFGIINVIDLTVLLVLGLLVVGGAYKVINAKPEVINESQKVFVTLEISNIRKPSVDSIKEGDMLYHYDRGQAFGRIIAKKVENYREPVPTSDGRMVMAEVPEKYRVILTVEADAIITDQAIIIGGQHTRVGSQFRLKNRIIAAFATVLGIDME